MTTSKGLGRKGFQMSKFIVLAGSRPKRAWAGVYPVVEGNWFHAEAVAYVETNCSMWDDCDCCEFSNEANIASVLAEAGMVYTDEQVWITDTLTAGGGLFAPEVVKA